MFGNGNHFVARIKGKGIKYEEGCLGEINGEFIKMEVLIEACIESVTLL